MKIQSVANVSVLHIIALDNESDHPEDDIQEMIVSAMKAISAKRWVSADMAQPNTVEFWARVCKGHTQQSAMTLYDWATKHKYFVKYLTRGCLASTESAVLDGIIPHLKALEDIAPGNMLAHRQVPLQASLRGLRFRSRG